MEVEEAAAAPPAPRIGRDELNLTEFPFAMLANRPGKSAERMLAFRDGQKEWSVEGSAAYGLPTAADVQVYVVLMELTREQGFPVVVEFNRSQVVRRLGWVHSGASYERLTLALDRLVGVTIRTKNAFYDARQRQWTTKEAFHILDAYKIADITQAHAKQPSLFPSWIRWSPELYANIQAGYIKALDVDFFLALESVIAQALYRYLDAKRGGDDKPFYRIGIKKLAFEHLGLSRAYYPSDIKRKLKTAHDELLARGFLSGWEYAPMKNGDDMVVYRFPPRRPRAEARPLPPAASAPDPTRALAERLIAAGASRHAAAELAAASPEECGRQLDYLPHRDARDRGAVLVKSIREGWSAPPSWVEAQEAKQTAERARRKQEAAERRIREREQQEAGFDGWWTTLPEDRRHELLALAHAALRKENRLMADFALKHPESPVTRETLRPYLKRLCGWSTKPRGFMTRRGPAGS